MPKSQADILLKSFLEVVYEEDLDDTLPQISRDLARMSSVSGKDKALVWTRTQLSKELMEQLKSVLSQKAGKSVEIENRLDGDLIGGFKIEWGEWLYDSSFKKNFENINKLLA